MKLDLSSNCVLEKKHLLLYNKIFTSSQNNYNSLLNKIANKNHKNIDWWVSNIATRNTQDTILFKYFCNVELVKFLLKTDTEIDQIIVDSKGLLNVLEQIKGVERLKIEFRKTSLFSEIIKKIRLVFVFSKIFLIKFSRLFIFVLFFKHKCSLPKSRVKLIDTYVLPGFYSNDRYYNGILKHLSKNEISKIYFVPTISFTPVFKFYAVFKELINSKRQFLFKEKFLKFSDIFHAAFYIFRIKSMKLKNIKQNKIDYSPLINECFQNFLGLSNSIEGLINYKFFKGLKKNNVKIDHVVDWWENQATDKGLQLGIKNFYPKTSTIGYIGFVPSSLDFHLFPTEYESNFKVIPQKIGLIGEGFISLVSQFNKKHIFFSAPAFRFQHVWNDRKRNNKNKQFTILLGLPISLSESLLILNMVSAILNKIKINNYTILVKTHPTVKKTIIKNAFEGSLPNKFEFINTTSELAILKSDLMISTLSSICLESMACGVPVLVTSNKNLLNNSPIPREIEQDLWKECQGENDILSGIEKFYSLRLNDSSNNLKIGKKIRYTYFKLNSREDSNSFLKIY